METAMLEAGPRFVMEAATGIIKQITISLSRSAAVGKTTGTFLEWARENRKKLDVFAQSLVKLLIPCCKKKKKGGKAWSENLWRIISHGAHFYHFRNCLENSAGWSELQRSYVLSDDAY